MENDKLKSRLHEVLNDPFTLDEESKLKKELNQLGNVNIWTGSLAPLGKATTDIDKSIKDLGNNFRGW
jgi:hypothetical protein